MLVSRPIILFIDAYDSFSNNIVALLETTLNVSVRTVKIDDPYLATDGALHAELGHYAAVVCGPGPGHPRKDEDVGIIQRIWRLGDKDILPVLGICLGFQSLCLEFGGEVKRLKGPQHGIIREVSHVGKQKGGGRTIFRGVGGLQATLYQSLCADTGHDLSAKEWARSKWLPTRTCPDLLPLAWVESDLRLENDSGIMDEAVLVAVQHRTKPFWGLQYHPESICSNEESVKVVRNWFKSALTWLRYRCERRIPTVGVDSNAPVHGQLARRRSLLQIYENHRMEKGISWIRTLSGLLNDIEFHNRQKVPGGLTATSNKSICHYLTIDLPENLSVTQIYEAVRGQGQDQILLESTNANQNCVGTADVRGSHSIIALDLDKSSRFEYTTGEDYATVWRPSFEAGADKQNAFQIPIASVGGIWPFLAKTMEIKWTSVGDKDSPFWGGLMGYMTYELGLEGIDVKNKNKRDRETSRPDLCLAWVTRSLVIDHRKGVIYIQALAGEQSGSEVQQWMDSVVQVIKDVSAVHWQFASDDRITPEHDSDLAFFKESVQKIETPSNQGYESKVEHCQEYIRGGDSYELCLTDQTTITRYKTTNNISGTAASSQCIAESSSSSPWALYKTLRYRQPAPFASFLRLGSATLVSSSPERFLTWDSSGNCELRPMKGTVKKSPTISTLAQATVLLNVPKEKAENLMIVDLVRHDLHGVCGTGNVSVPRLMVVEEYASVFQMVSVVQGRIPPAVEVGTKDFMTDEEVENAEKERYTGIDALAASLPPGSMTGAPKRRSCELLQDVEGGRERGLYSGVVGYMDVGGRGDWSVTIRSLFKWDDEDAVDEEKGETEVWRVGAGGAVTALSTPMGEREEMQTKLGGTLGIFR